MPPIRKKYKPRTISGMHNSKRSLDEPDISTEPKSKPQDEPDIQVVKKDSTTHDDA